MSNLIALPALDQLRANGAFQPITVETAFDLGFSLFDSEFVGGVEYTVDGTLYLFTPFDNSYLAFVGVDQVQYLVENNSWVALD